MEEEFKYLNQIDDVVTIHIPRKDLEVMKLLYHFVPHRKGSFSDFVFLAAKKGMNSIIWESPDQVQARLWLATIDKDPYIPNSELESTTGMPDGKPPRFPLKEWKSPRMWQVDWYIDFWTWWSFTPRWKR